MSMLINDLLFVCMLLSFLCAYYHHHIRESSSETMINGPLLVIRQTFYASLLVILFSILIKFKNTKNIFSY
jgi:hypothetical protein